MPIRTNMYNDDSIGALFGNLAQTLAPPSGTELASLSTAGLNNQKRQQIADLFANPNQPDFDRRGIVAGLYNPTQSFYAQNQNDATARRGQDITARTDITKSMLAPVAQDAVRYVPPSIADLYGVDQRQEGLRTPLTETQVKGGLLQQQLPANPPALTDAQTVALTMGNTPVENIKTPDGPRTVYRTDAVGQEPAYAPPSSSVTVNNGGETAYDKTLGEGNAKTELQVQDDAAKAQGTLNTVDVMRTLMADPNFYSGPAATQIQAAKEIGASLGLAPFDAASPMEAFNALSSQLVIDAAGGSLGNQISNGDVGFLNRTKPNLNNTPEGNKVLLDITEKLAQRKQEVAQWAQDYKAAHGGRLDGGWLAYQKQRAEAEPLFPAPPDGAAAPAGGFTEGQTATNKATGQKVVFRNDQWVPM